MRRAFLECRNIVLAAVLASSACDRRDPEPVPQSEPPAAAADASVQPSQNLRDEAEHLAAFLQGQAPLQAELLADSVTLYIAPEGGGEQRRVSKQELQDRAAWRIGSRSFVPPDGLTQLTTSAGTHFNCVETLLASKDAELARQPHISVKLMRPDADSCLQTWNVTFVFSDEAERPRLTAVVYDQWEW